MIHTTLTETSGKYEIILQGTGYPALPWILAQTWGDNHLTTVEEKRRQIDADPGL